MGNVNSDLAYNYIRKKIISGGFRPGQALMTPNLAKEIGVSRTPIRDALRQLESDGLVTIQPELGAKVKTMDANEFKEMCVMRLALESFAAGLAAVHRSEEDLHEMRYALETMRELTGKLLASREDDEWFEELILADIRFHVAVITAAKNELMKKEILRLHLISRVLSSGGKHDEDKASRDERKRHAVLSHQKIFDAIEQQDVTKSKLEMEDHIQTTIDYSLRRLLPATPPGPKLRELTEEELSYIG